MSTTYWRAVAYDRFDGYQWTWSTPADHDVKADNGLLGESADNPLNQKGARQVSIEVRELDLDPRSIFAPGEPVSVSVDSKLTTVSPPAGLAGTSHFARALRRTRMPTRSRRWSRSTTSRTPSTD